MFVPFFLAICLQSVWLCHFFSSDFSPVSMIVPLLQLFVPRQYDYAHVSIDLSLIGMIKPAFLSIFLQSVWLCQHFYRFVPSQCDCASVSIHLFAVRMTVPVFLPSCPQSVWLCQCFCRHVPSQYDCATTPYSHLSSLPLIPIILHIAYSSFTGTHFEWRPKHPTFYLGSLLYLEWLRLSWSTPFTYLLIFAQEEQQM
jgi:hypothetical protein